MSSSTVSVTPGTGSSTTTTSSSSVIKTTKKQQQKRIVSNENDESVPITNDFLNNDNEEDNEDDNNEQDSSSEANNITSTNTIPITINNTQLILNLNDNEIEQANRADENYDDGNYDEGGGDMQTLSNRTHKFLESSDDQLIKQIFSQTITSAGVTPTDDDDDEDTQKMAPFILGVHKLGAGDSTLKMQQHPSIVIDCYDDDEAGIEYNLDDPVETDDTDVYNDNFTIQNHYFDQTIVDEDDVDLDEDVPVVNVEENFDQNIAIAGIDLKTEEDHNVQNEGIEEKEDLSVNTKLEEELPNLEQNKEGNTTVINVEHDTQNAVENSEDKVIALVDNTWTNENETAANANTNKINIDNDNTNIDSVS